MHTILGIDAGGTFTDSVIIDAETKQVLHKAKTLTSRKNLKKCLNRTFAELPPHLVPTIMLVNLSTTLATNAIVEGRGCKEGLILIGDKPAGKVLTPRHALVKGKHDIKGRLIEQLDLTQVHEVVESFRDKVDAMAVSGYASIRSPEHELLVRAAIEDLLDVPVVCAHELSSQLGFHDRTVTAVLNARLIPLVWELMDSVRAAMARHQVTAPLMMVRGDGTLMADTQAYNRPIETILSGPAASAIGAVHLSGRPDCFVMDIGGTTTDVAHVSEGRLVIRSEGAKVGGWSTHVRAGEVFTVGLGGDSRIYVDSEDRLRIGPERSISYSVAAARDPELVEELEQIWADRDRLRLRRTHEAFALVKKHKRLSYTGDESIMIEVLRHQPRTLHYLEQTIALPGLRSILTTLIQDGVVQRISLTPTDIWHVNGQYSPWDPQAADLALRIAADQRGQTPEELIAQVQHTLRRQLDTAAIRAAVYIDRQDLDFHEGGAADYFLNRLCLEPDSRSMRASYRLLKPVVAIGAPAATWLTGVGVTSLCEPEVPEHAEVANALGAAVAQAVENLEILIRQDTVTGHFLVFSPMGRLSLPTLEAATAAAKASGDDFVAHWARGRAHQVESRVEDFEIASLSRDRKLLVERVVHVSAHLHR